MGKRNDNHNKDRAMQKKHIFTVLCLASLCLGIMGTSSAADFKTHTNSIGMEFVLIPAGKIPPKRIGKNAFEEDMFTTFVISKPFYIGKYEVTQAQWKAVMGSNPSTFSDPSRPIETISWNDAQEFIRRLNAKEGHKRYRLPTEMEWEFAARGGTNTRYFFGERESALGQYAWFSDNSGDKTHPVGQKKPNQFGLYDIYGNVGEWVQDWHGALPARKEASDYCGVKLGTHRVNRGGNWGVFAKNCNSIARFGRTPNKRYDYVGLRLALSPE